jgi:hypothetical protein
MVFQGRKPLPLPAYSPVAGRRSALFLEQTARFFPHQMGAYFITLSNSKGGAWGDTPFWEGDTVSDKPLTPEGFSMDAMARHIIEGDPDARIIIRYGPGEPASWRALHPEELWHSEEGEPLAWPSMASTAFQKKALAYSAAVVRFCESHDWADRIIGYWNGHCCEGTPEPVINDWIYDHSPAMKKRWQTYLKSKYKTVSTLREAYQDKTLTFQSVPLPRDPLKGDLPAINNRLYWQSPAENRPMRDYIDLVTGLFHQWSRDLAKTMREATPRQRFYLYDFLKISMQGWANRGFFDQQLGWPLQFPEHMGFSGHLRVAELFDAEGFDGIITPHDYQARGIGGVYEPEGIADSAILRGKLFFCEMDTRSWTGTDPIFPARNVKEYAAITWRNLAAGWTRGFYNYWMDVYQDWFADAAMHKVIRHQVEAIKDSVNWDHKTVPGIAMMLDDQALLETSGSGHVMNEHIMWEQKTGMAHCGVPYRIYLLQDLALKNFPRHKVFYFPNLYRVDEAKLALLRKTVFREGNLVIWGPGSGIAWEDKTGPEGAEKLTGFQFDCLRVNHQRRIRITDFTHPLTRSLPADLVIGGPLSYGPILFPTDGIRLGEAWTKRGMDRSGLALKTIGQGKQQWYSLFTTAAPLPAALWRECARFAGAHIYSEENDHVLASQHLVSLHTVKPGRKTIALPRKTRFREITRPGSDWSKPVTRITYTAQAPETRVFLLE